MQNIPLEILLEITNWTDLLSRVRASKSCRGFRNAHLMLLGARKCVTKVAHRTNTLTVMIVDKDGYLDGEMCIYRRARSNWQVTSRAMLVSGMLTASWRYSIFGRLADVIKYNNGKVVSMAQLSPEGNIVTLVKGVVDGNVTGATEVWMRKGDVFLPVYYDLTVTVHEHPCTQDVLNKQEIQRLITICGGGKRAHYTQMFPTIKK